MTSPTINKQFGPTVRTIREAAGISLRELARRLGWSAAYVSDIELGRRNPPRLGTRVQAWADAIGAGNLEELMELAERSRAGRGDVRTVR
jgi:transcriptional regulator with XRE-family HTH domain